jgi:hypothetical protein
MVIVHSKEANNYETSKKYRISEANMWQQRDKDKLMG